MRTWIRWSLRILGVIVVIGAILVAFNRERLLRLYNVNTLFAQENIIGNFSNMKDMFLWKSIKIGNNFKANGEFEASLSPMPQTYDYNGKTGDINQRLEQLATTSLLVLHRGIIVHEQ